MNKYRTKTAIALILMFAMAFSLVALPAVFAQNTWSIHIEGRTSDWRIRGEVRLDNSRQQETFTGIMLRIRPPGAADWTLLGPFSTDNGRVDYFYNDVWGAAVGEYQFQYIVPAQDPLPENPATEDGEWYSDTISLTYDPARIVTYPFIGAVPNPAGVGQEVLLHVGIFQQTSSIHMGWDDLSITIEKPDGTTETLANLRTDSTGGTGAVFVPAEVGNYTLQGHFPEQITTPERTAPGIATGSIMLASSSEKITLVVQEETAPIHPGMPLPTEYWTRPIDAQLREWHTISGSWLVPGRRNPQVVSGNAEAPETAHILWTKPLTWGGLAGGEITGDKAFSHGDAYEGKWDNKYIVNGIVVYIHREADRPREYTAVDIRTGEQLWTSTFLDNSSISFAQSLYWDSYNHHAVYSYLWVTVGTTWYAFNPYNAQPGFTITNVPSGTNVYGESGRIYRYSISSAAGTMSIWNMSALISWEGSWGPGGSPYATYDAGGWTGTTAAQQRAYTVFEIPTGLPNVRAVGLGDRVFGMQTARTHIRTWAFSLVPGDEGRLLYDRTWDAPSAWVDGNLDIEFNVVSLEDGVAVIWTKETREYYGFSTETGHYLWGPAEPEHYLNYYGWTAFGERPTIIYDGKLYSTGTSGIIYCYDVHTGATLWEYHVDDPYTEILWANDWWQMLLFIADGKLYTGHLEHSAIEPMPRGAPFVCLNATTGELIWRADGLFRQTMWGGLAIIGDSVIVTMDTYDQRVYAIGRGPSATTVTAPDIGVPLGKFVLVRGTVTDVSPGTQDSGISMRFANGVPAVGDESMSEWMTYVYKQFPRPADVVGVEVVVSVLDPNNNYYEVGRTIADEDGFFSVQFEPEVPGKYTVIAEFEGSKAYYGSHAKTAVFVEEAPSPPTEPTPPPESIADIYFIPAVIGIIIAIVVVGAVIVLMQRKR
jgi:outer membrane protein assembly factor BamB